MKNGGKSLIFTMLATLAVFSCKHDPAEYMPEDSPPLDSVWRIPPTNNCDSGVVYFENQILKIIVTKCAMTTGGCHGMSPFEEGVDLRSYSSIMENVKPGDLNDSKIYEKITELNPDEKPMPPLNKWQLTNEEKTLIRDWILQGAPNNKCEPCEDNVFTSFEETITPLMFKNCSGCHNDAYQQTSGNLSSSPYPPSLTNINKSDVEGFHAGILGTLVFSDTNSLSTAMPRNIGKLYECEVKKFEMWSKSLSP